MRLEVIRSWPSHNSVIGLMTLENSSARFYSLEPPYASADIKPRAIPAGTYPVQIRWSAHFGKLVPHVDNVPGFDAIEIHIGNFPKDTHGCTLVGLSRGPMPDFIARSEAAFEQLMQILIQDAEDRGALSGDPTRPQSMVYDVGTITYTDVPQVPATPPDVDGEVSV